MVVSSGDVRATWGFALSAQAAEGRWSDSEVGSNVSEVYALANVRELLNETHVPFACRQRKPFLVRAVKPPVFVLMDDAAPVGQFDVVVEQIEQVGEAYPVGLSVFECFDVFLAWLAIIQFVHTEHDVAF